MRFRASNVAFYSFEAIIQRISPFFYKKVSFNTLIFKHLTPI